MKHTDTELKLPNEGYYSKSGRFMLKGFEMRFNLSEEDFLLIANELLPTMGGADLGDAFLACLTFGIHKAIEEKTGKPFVLDMDRERSKA